MSDSDTPLNKDQIEFLTGSLRNLVLAVDAAREVEDDSALPDAPSGACSQDAWDAFHGRRRGYETGMDAPSRDWEKEHTFMLQERWYEEGVPDAVRYNIARAQTEQQTSTPRVHTISALQPALALH